MEEPSNKKVKFSPQECWYAQVIEIEENTETLILRLPKRKEPKIKKVWQEFHAALKSSGYIDGKEDWNDTEIIDWKLFILQLEDYFRKL